MLPANSTRTWLDHMNNNAVENNEKQKEGPTDKRPKKALNFYWIYGIIILVILSINLFQYGGGMVKIDPTEYQKMLEAGDVQRIVVVNDQMVKVFIKKDHLDKEPHKSKIKGSPIAGENVAGPHYAFNLGTSMS